MPSTTNSREPRIVVLVSTIVLLFTLSGCHFTETLWSVQSPSPDRNWIASARSDNTDTIGNEEFTIVSLRKAGFWHRTQQILVFEGIDYEKDFKIAWTSPSRLEVSVPENIRVLHTDLSNLDVSIFIHYLPKQELANQK